MTPFKPNVTKSIDNLNQAERNIEKLKVLFDEVYIDAPEKIDQMLVDNIETKSGSDITINNTVDNGKMDWEFKGNCKQQTYTGKNKLDLTQCTFANCTLNQNGSVTSNISNAYYCSIDASYLKDYILANKGNTITFSLDKAIANKRASILIIGTRTGGETTQEQNGADNTNYVTMQIASDWETITTFAIRFNRSTEAFTDTTSVFNEFMLEESPTVTSYEPYVGGIPAPNPDFPQVIKTVTGTNQVVLQNKNLLPFNNQDFTINDVRFKCENGRLKINGTANGNVWNNNSNFKNNFNFILPPGTYYFARNVEVNSYIRDYNNDTTLVQNNGMFTLETTTKVYFSVYFTTETSFDNLTDTAQLEKGSTYSESIPHKEQTFTVHLGDIELAGIDAYNDKIALVGDNWKILRNVAKYTSCESVVLTSSAYRFMLKPTSQLHDITTGLNVEADAITNIGIKENECFARYNNGWGGLALFTAISYVGNIGNLQQAKTWFDENIVVYIGINPDYDYITEIPILDATLLEELNAIYNTAKCYEGQTNIETIADSGNVKMILDLNAFVTEKEV